MCLSTSFYLFVRKRGVVGFECCTLVKYLILFIRVEAVSCGRGFGQDVLKLASGVLRSTLTCSVGFLLRCRKPLPFYRPTLGYDWLSCGDITRSLPRALYRSVFFVIKVVELVVELIVVCFGYRGIVPEAVHLGYFPLHL